MSDEIEIKPLTRNDAVLDFLQTRRSRPVRSLQAPVPSRDDLETILKAAARTPDHKMLVPWRFIVLERDALQRLTPLVAKYGEAAGIEQKKIDNITGFFGNANLVVAVVCTYKECNDFPRIEQDLSAGAVCMNLLNAAQASGWGANWLTGFTAFHKGFLSEGLGIEGDDYVAGYIHLGSEGAVPSDRKRPDLAEITEWVSA
ncbi:nitroreductase family protein [Halocynthiibacter styelae]|uniref:Putative NAD(P)H nitroreductase n=1 Tax=Halocynthiibacter styelae TaxID=2761955 RepID=A0A8J7LK35_9RHOB|nr:nitroreductase [Paenihalocynthiibacter styelae]MBI1493100.1 nitroreductase [Paenihalocynthiibacter styelae]